MSRLFGLSGVMARSRGISNLKSTTAASGSLKLDPSAVSLHGPLRDRQTQTCTAAVAGPRIVDPIEPVEHFAIHLQMESSPFSARSAPMPSISSTGSTSWQAACPGDNITATALICLSH
jgi:hypothetical protein